MIDWVRWSPKRHLGGCWVLYSKSGQNLQSWKCFSYTYCTRGGKSWLYRTHRAHRVEEDTLLEATRFEGGHHRWHDGKTYYIAICTALERTPVHLSPMCNRTSPMFNTTHFATTVLPSTLRYFSCICDMTHHASYIRDQMHSCVTRLGPMCIRTSPMFNMTHFVTTVLPSTIRHAAYIRDTMHWPSPMFNTT